MCLVDVPRWKCIDPTENKLEVIRFVILKITVLAYLNGIEYFHLPQTYFDLEDSWNRPEQTLRCWLKIYRKSEAFI